MKSYAETQSEYGIKESPLVEPAPMAGYTDQAFRRVLRRCGAAVTWTEMISATALVYKSKRTFDMLREDMPEKTVVQLFGNNPKHFESVLKSGVLDHFKEININMGCPARKIMTNGDGVALMQKPELARQIIEACVRSTSKPVSVKFRLGYDEANGSVAVEFAKMCETAGASRLIVHGRFGSQGYSGKADWNNIAAVVRAVKIPVIANGDITDITIAASCIKITGAAGVMMGRALIGAPWLISAKNEKRTMMNEEEIKEIIKYHIEQSISCAGEGSVLPMRKQLIAYCNHLTGGKEMKLQIIKAMTFGEIKKIML